MRDQEGSPVAGLDFGSGLLQDPAFAQDLMALHKRFERAHESLEASEAIAALFSSLATRLSPAVREPTGALCREGLPVSSTISAPMPVTMSRSTIWPGSRR
jgi:hypothetical protein